MKIEIDPVGAQAFMTALLKVERNGMPLTLASALVALEIDPWSFAGELAVAPRREAVKRLRTVLGRVDVDRPEMEMIARKAIASLPQPSVVGADLVTVVRLASRNRDLTGALLCSLALTALAVSLLLSMLTGNPLPPLVGYCGVALTWAVLPPSRSNVLRPYLAFSSGIVGLIFAMTRLAT